MSRKNITVFSASTNQCAQAYLDMAKQFGYLLGQNHFDLVYGGSYVGCMKNLADGAREGGAKVTGVIPQNFFDRGIQDDKCDELIVTQTYRERKDKLCSLADIFMTLPGGLGSLDELVEVITLTSIGEMNKPIHVLDPYNDYKPLFEMLTNLEAKKLIREGKTKLYQIHKDAESFFKSLND